jgi:fido (protein-threonine AMPylation protein)
MRASRSRKSFKQEELEEKIALLDRRIQVLKNNENDDHEQRIIELSSTKEMLFKRLEELRGNQIRQRKVREARKRLNQGVPNILVDLVSGNPEHLARFCREYQAILDWEAVSKLLMLRAMHCRIVQSSGDDEARNALLDFCSTNSG